MRRGSFLSSIFLPTVSVTRSIPPSVIHWAPIQMRLQRLPSIASTNSNSCFSFIHPNTKLLPFCYFATLYPTLSIVACPSPTLHRQVQYTKRQERNQLQGPFYHFDPSFWDTRLGSSPVAVQLFAPSSPRVRLLAHSRWLCAIAHRAAREFLRHGTNWTHCIREY